jgi:hypothetical protein
LTIHDFQERQFDGKQVWFPRFGATIKGSMSWSKYSSSSHLPWRLIPQHQGAGEAEAAVSGLAQLKECPQSRWHRFWKATVVSVLPSKTSTAQPWHVLGRIRTIYFKVSWSEC